MRYIYIITISLILASCGPSSEDKNIAAVTCSIMGETRDIDAAVRVREMNNAREKIGGEPFLKGDSVIQEAFEYGLCQQLVLNENYNEALQSRKKAKEDRPRVEAGGKDGFFEWYYKNGQLEAKGNWKDGKRHGLWETYHENGQLEARVNYKDGKLEGLAEQYYENGQLKAKGSFKEGKIDGFEERYYENGQLDSRR